MSTYVIVNGQFYNANELYHHGVKGQKWGVRRYQNKDGSLTSAGKKRRTHLRNDDVIIEKGTQLNNLTSKKKLRLRALGSENSQKLFVYKESDEHDSDVYEGAFTRYIRRRDRTGQIFKQKFENIDDLVSPSERRRAELFVETYRNNPELLADQLNRTDAFLQQRKAEGVKMSRAREALIGKKIFDEKTSDIDLNKYGYGLFNMSNEWKDPQSVRVNNAYYKTVKNAGYNALIDDNNRGIYNDANEPLIVLNAKRHLKNIETEKLTREYMNEAEERLRSYMKKKYGDDAIAV